MHPPREFQVLSGSLEFRAGLRRFPFSERWLGICSDRKTTVDLYSHTIAPTTMTKPEAEHAQPRFTHKVCPRERITSIFGNPGSNP